MKTRSCGCWVSSISHLHADITVRFWIKMARRCNKSLQPRNRSMTFYMNGIEVRFCFCFIVIVPLRAKVILNGFLFEVGWLRLGGSGEEERNKRRKYCSCTSASLVFFSQVQSSEDDRASNKRTWMPGIDCQTASVSASLM